MIRSLRSQLYESPVISCLMSSERPGEKKNVQPFFSLNNNNNNNNNKRVDAEKVWDFNMLQVATISSLNIPLRQQKKKYHKSLQHRNKDNQVVIWEAISNGITYALAVIEQGEFEKHCTEKNVEEKKEWSTQTFQLIGMQVPVLNKLR